MNRNKELKEKELMTVSGGVDPVTTGTARRTYTP